MNAYINGSGHATLADSVGDRFQPRYVPKQTPLDVSPKFANPIYRSMPTSDGQSYGTGLSWGTVQKIQELKGLMNKYSSYHREWGRHTVESLA